MSVRPTRKTHVVAVLVGTTVIGFLLSMLFLSGLAAQRGNDGSIVIYDDALSPRFADWSWAATDLTVVPAGQDSRVIGVDFGPWGGVFLAAQSPISLEGGETLRFRVGPDAERGEAPETLEVVVFGTDWSIVARDDVAVTDGWVDHELVLAEGGVSIRAVWWQDQGTGGHLLLDDIAIHSAIAEEPAPPVSVTQVPTTPLSITSTTTPEPETTTTTAATSTITTAETPSNVTVAPRANPDAPGVPEGYAVYETFDGDPSAPSQALLPDNFDFVVTNRTHPKDAIDPFPSFPADHAEDCAGPNPAVVPLPQHEVTVSHHSNGTNPDESFFVCKNHMMSSLGDVSGYSVSAFWPRQEFDFSNGGRIEFEVNLDERKRQWWEVMIIPADELKTGAADEFWPIDEVYANDRIVFDFNGNKRRIHTGNGPGRDGRVEDFVDYSTFADRHPSDPANTDRRIRRSNVLEINPEGTQLSWSIEAEDGSFDTKTVDLTEGLPLERGLVIFTTHAYTPTKDGNDDVYTFHWDNIGFTGPVVGQYDVYEAPEAITLESNGDRPIGDSVTQTIDIPEVPNAVRLAGQVHYPLRGQVLLSINGADPVVVDPFRYTRGDCAAEGWNSFMVELDRSQLRAGENTFEWSVGPRPNCPNSYVWDGFSIKSLEIQGRAG